MKGINCTVEDLPVSLDRNRVNEAGGRVERSIHGSGGTDAAKVSAAIQYNDGPVRLQGCQAWKYGRGERSIKRSGAVEADDALAAGERLSTDFLKAARDQNFPIR